MSELQNPQALHDIFVALPKRIKDWFGSDQVGYIVEEISNRLALDEEKTTVIPGMIFRLLVQDLEPIDFINELALELGIDFPTAKTIAEDIEKKVLRPIEGDLRRDVGVDLKLIYFGKPSAKRAEPKLQTAPAATDAKPASPISPTGQISPIGPISPAPLPPVSHPTEWEKLRAKTTEKATVNLQSFEIKGGDRREDKSINPISPIGQIGPMSRIGPISPMSPVSPISPIPEPTPTVNVGEAEPLATPFMLHEENYGAGAKIETSFKTPLNIKVQNYSQEAEQSGLAPLDARLSNGVNRSTNFTAPTIASKPVSVKLETPQDAEQRGTNADLRGKNSNGATRVVHYSEFMTPVNSLGTPRNAEQRGLNADLRGQGRGLTQMNASRPPEINIENKVDLRKFAKPDESIVDLRKK